MIFFSAAYLAGCVLDHRLEDRVVGLCSQSEMNFHFLPSHCWTRARSRALVVGAGELDRLHHAVEAELP